MASVALGRLRHGSGRLGSEGSGGGGGGRAGEPGPPGRDPGYGAVGFWAVRGVRSAEGASALERTWSPTSPLPGRSGRNLRNPALKPATAPCSLCPLHLGPRGTFGGSFSRGPAGRRERLCTGLRPSSRSDQSVASPSARCLHLISARFVSSY